jgi:hypothetical protein
MTAGMPLQLGFATWAPRLPLRPYCRPTSTSRYRRISPTNELPSIAIGRLRISPIPALAYAAYMPYISLLSPAHSPLLPEQHPLLLAAQLSLNFNYVMPLLLPAFAPSLDPALEAIFNVTVAWAILFLGFACDSPGAAHHAKTAANFSDDDTVKPPFVPSATWAVTLVPIVTNIIWLPYLALRNRVSSASVPRTPPLLASVAQSPLLPTYALVTVLASAAYFAFAHASDALPAGDLGARLADLRTLCRDDILASSFAADCAMFAIFQGWLVKDDAALRAWSGPRAETAKTAARFVPFFGLCWYLFERAADVGARKL